MEYRRKDSDTQRHSKNRSCRRLPQTRNLFHNLFMIGRKSMKKKELTDSYPVMGEKKPVS